MNGHMAIQLAPRRSVLTASGDWRSLGEPGRSQDHGAIGLGG